MKHIKLYSSILLLVIATCKCFAQPECSTTFFKKEILSIAANGLEYQLQPTKIFIALDSNIIVSGRLNYSSIANPNIMRTDSSYVAKIDRDGNAIWFKSFADSGLGSTRIIQLQDSSFIVYSCAILTSLSISSLYLTKLDKHGVFLWHRIQSMNDGVMIGDMYATSDGGMIATGGAKSTMLVCRFEANGDFTWSKNYEWENHYGAFYPRLSNRNSLAEVSDAYIITDLYSFGVYSPEGIPNYIVKINKNNGNLIWTKKITQKSCQIMSLGIVQHGDDITIVMTSYGYGNTNKGILFIKMNTNGTLTNTVGLPMPYPPSIIGFEGYNYAFSFNKLNDGIVAIFSDTTLNRSFPYSMFYLNKDFTIDWAKSYQMNLANSDVSPSWPLVVQSKEAGIYSIFNWKGQSGVGSKTFLLKTDLNGNIGKCETSDIDIYLYKPAITISDISCEINEISCVSSTGSLQLNDRITTSPNIICSSTSYCSIINIIGNDKICNLSDSAEFKVIRNGECFTSPLWKLADTSYGNIRTYSDSSIKIQFKRTGQVYLYTNIVTGCGILKDSMLISISKPANTGDLGKDFDNCLNNSFTLSPGEGFTSYLWSDGSVQPFISSNIGGLYHVEVTDACNNTFRDSIYVNTVFPEAIDLGSDFKICPFEIKNILAPAGFTTYQWSTGSNDRSISVREPGVYKLTATNSFGCISTDSILVRLDDECKRNIYVPSAFTPNNDGLNDIFRASYSFLPEKFNLKIYNRYGQLIYYGNNPMTGWNGFFKGKLQNTGSYVWQIEYQFTGEAMQQLKGSVLLLR